MDSTRSVTYGQCRCCLENGYHRDIMKAYYSKGARQVYYDIFMECFNLFLSTNMKLSRLICSSCVKRLQEAQAFRSMAINSERVLLELDPGGDKEMLFVNVPVGEHTLGDEPDIKLEHEVEVKQEPDDIEFDDYFDSEPASCASYPKQSSTAELVEGEAALLARFPPGSLKRLPTRRTLHQVCPGFARHLDALRGKIILPEMIEKLLSENIEKKHRMYKTYVSEKLAHINNASTLLEHSNITPFKSKNRTGFPCFYCRNTFVTLKELQEHQKVHRKCEARKILATYGVESLVVYVDITDLKCTICNTALSNLTELKSHITKVHSKEIHLDITDRVIPFKLAESNVYECQMCGFTFETFGSIERHMNVHYRNYVCKECGTGFVTKYRLKVHVKSMHVEGSFTCDQCKKIYTSQQKLKNHVDTVHKLVKRFKCPQCLERFSEYFRRQKHMVTVHGVAPLRYKCNVCDKSFDRRYTLSRHLKRDHLEERDYKCDKCSYNCFTNNELRIHMVKHGGERIFECAVCKKSYARKKTLKEHMRIHNNDRRFACAVCGQTFVQKCSLKGHIKTHHVEYSLQ